MTNHPRRLLLHAITTAEHPQLFLISASGLRGLRGLRLQRLEIDGLLAWVTEMPEAGEPLDRADLLDHHRIASALCEAFDACLPARFSADFDEDRIRAKRDELIDALDGVRGRAELAVTAVWTGASAGEPPDQESAAAGTRYLHRRRSELLGSDRRRARANELADEIERGVGPHLADARRQICPSPAVALSLAMLVPRARAETLKNALPRAGQDVRILVNGPWPPYTFATLR